MRFSRTISFAAVSLSLITASGLAQAQDQTQPPTQAEPQMPPQARVLPRGWTPEAIEDLGQSASSRTDFSFDHSMLVLASKLDDEDLDLRRVVAGIDGVSVHRFHFQDPGMYDPAILAAVRQQYHAAGWQHLSVSHPRDGGPGATELWLRFENNTIRNIAVLVAGRNQINFVSVSGSISPIDLTHLGGHFGIPRIEGGVVIAGPQPGAQQGQPQGSGY